MCLELNWERQDFSRITNGAVDKAAIITVSIINNAPPPSISLAEKKRIEEKKGPGYFEI